MRDAQSKLDQVIAFTGKTITADDVSTVLGLVGRDLLLDTVQAVADEDAPAAFALAARAVEMGYDLRAVCRELSRVVRDLLVLSVDPSRISDPEIAGEGERDRLKALAGRFSREDLLRAFDLLTRAEADIRSAAQPRYHLEMALLRWIYLRKLVPIEDLIAGSAATRRARLRRPPERSHPRESRLRPRRVRLSRPSTSSGRPELVDGRTPPESSSPARAANPAPAASGFEPDLSAGASAPRSAWRQPDLVPARSGSLKDALLAEIRKPKAVFYNTVVAQAQKIEVAGDRVTFTFSPKQRALRDTFEQNRAWLESVAQQAAGRKIAVACAADGRGGRAAGRRTARRRRRTRSLRCASRRSPTPACRRCSKSFPAEIRDVEEM